MNPRKLEGQARRLKEAIEAGEHVGCCAYCGWPLHVSSHLDSEPCPDVAEFVDEVLRSIDALRGG